MRNTPRLRTRFRVLRGLRVVAAVFVCLAVGAAHAIAFAQTNTIDELREARKQVEADEEALEGEIDYLNASVADALNALEIVTAARDRAQADLDAATANVVAATTRLAQATAKIEELNREITETEELLRQSAISAFRSYQGPNSEQSALGENPWQSARTDALHNFVNRSTENALDRYRGQGAELQSLLDQAAESEAEANLLLVQEQNRTAAFDAAWANEQNALDALDARLDHRLEEAQFLEDLDAELAAKIRTEEKRIADAIAAAQRRARRVAIPVNAPVDLVTVAGPAGEILVNASIAVALSGFLEAMERAGFALGGYGYRTNTRQIELRQQHCGTSEFAVYQMSPSQCRPPTARPGFSQHEVGLAVDFTHNGRIIRSRSSAVFQAMTRIAPQYGFKNLPSEPWHWSTTGS